MSWLFEPQMGVKERGGGGGRGVVCIHDQLIIT